MPIRFLSKALVAALALNGTLSATAQTRTTADQTQAMAVLQFKVIVPAGLRFGTILK